MRVTYLGASLPQSILAENKAKIPLYIESVSAGFPSPAQDYIEQTLDLNSLCIQRPLSTFFVRVQGDSMIDLSIHSGDILVVDRSLLAKHGDVIIASIHGEMTVKCLELKPEVLLRPKNKAYPAIPITEDSEFEVFGVVTSVVRQLKQS